MALSIAGSDSGGGAGVQADLAAFSYFGVFGTTAITAVTAQNPREVSGICAVDPATVAAQIEAVFAAFDVAAVKTGMLFSAEIIRSVSDVLSRCSVPLVVDPVMVSTSGARLLHEDAVQAMVEGLLPQALLFTPNLPEAEVLCGTPLRSREAIRRAAVRLATEAGAAVMIKGGHQDEPMALDTVSDGRRIWELAAPRSVAMSTHGTGCSLSAAIAACLARGDSLEESLHKGKAYVLGRLRRSIRVGPDTWAMAPPETLPLDDIHVSEC